MTERLAISAHELARADELVRGAAVTERLAMSVEEIARAVGASASTIKRAVDRGDLPRLPHVGRRILVPTHAVHAWVAGTTSTTNEESRQQFAPADGSTPTTEGTRDAEHPRP